VTARWSFVLLAAAAAVAHADPIPAKARTLAERGRLAHDQRDYAGAIVAFTEAYAIAPAPGLLFNLAQAYRLKGNCDDAQLMYRRYLDANPSGDGRALAQAHLATVERCVQNRMLRVAVDPQLRAITIPAAPRVDAVARSPRKQRSRSEKIGAGVAIAGGAALLAAVYYGLEARDIASRVERRYADGEKWPKLAPLDAEGDRMATRAGVAAISGLAALAAGTTMLVVGHRTRGGGVVRVEPTTRGARIGARWHF
jgi:tetratricopeptide (TPR) repeat protein